MLTGGISPRIRVEVGMPGDLLEGLIGGILRIIGGLIVEILFEVVCYYIGYPVVKVLTLGKYPKRHESPFRDGETRQSAIVSAVGLAVLVAAGVCAFLFIRKNGG